MTKEIQLTQGQVAIVDDWWFDELNQYKWQATWNPHTKSYYAVRQSGKILGKNTTIRMHAVVARTPKGAKTDHANHNTLDNRFDNLRICTNFENQHNRGKRADNTSGYKGVCKADKKWQATIWVNRKPQQAARIYDDAAKRLHGEFAFSNFKKA
jgi:hypothetical protein